MTAGQKLDLSQTNIEWIRSKDCLRRFNCGEREIDGWAKDKAWKFHDRGRARVFVARNDGGGTQGFYSLSFSTENSSKLDKADRDAWKDGAPLVYVDYLAVAAPVQNCGLGSVLLIDALKRAHRVSREVAFYGVALRSLNDRTTTLYMKYGFGLAPDEEEARHPLMILPIWTVEDLFKSQG